MKTGRCRACCSQAAIGATTRVSSRERSRIAGAVISAKRMGGLGPRVEKPSLSSSMMAIE